MTPECELAISAIEASLNQQPSFKSGAKFSANERMDGNAAVVVISADCKYGFTVKYRTTEGEILADQAAIGAQLNALAIEEVCRRYQKMRPLVQSLSEEVQK